LARAYWNGEEMAGGETQNGEGCVPEGEAGVVGMREACREN